MRILGPLVCLILSHCLCAQVNLDSLFKALNTSQVDTHRVDVLKDIASYYLEVHIDSSLTFAEQGLALAKKTGYTKGELYHTNIIGNYYQRNSSYDTAMTYYDRVMEISEATNDLKGKAIALNNIAILHTYVSEYTEALAKYHQALEYEFELADTTGIAEAYNNIGVVHYYLGDLDKTLKYFELSIAMSEAIGDESVLKKGYNNLGALYDYAKDYERALIQYQKAYDLALQQGEKKELGIMVNNIATAYSGMNQLDKAMHYYHESLDLREEMHDMQGLAMTYLNMAGVSYKMKRYSEFEKHMSTSLEYTYAYDLKFLRAELFENLGQYRKDQNRFEEALDFAEQHRLLRDSILNEERIMAVAEMETKYETAQKERQLLEEQSKNDQLAKEKAESDLKVSQRNGMLVLSGSVLLSFLLLGLFITQRNKRRSEQEKARAILSERDKGMKAVLSAQEEERSRISKDLHDGVGQQLSGLKMGFQLLKNNLIKSEAEVGGKLDKLTRILDETASDVRSLSHQMMPKSLKQLGLSPALEDMLEKSLGACAIGYQFEEIRPVGRLTATLELSLYRIAQELVNNIIKHSEAKQVDVQLYTSKDHVIMTVEDDGKGFDTTSENRGHGMLNIENRVRLIQGHLDIESSSSQGTRVSLRTPLERA